VGYTGHDGFTQQYTLDAFGLRTGMEQKGDANRLTLEELLQGHALETTEAAEPSADEWVTTSYAYDVTMPYGQLLTETTGNVSTAYTYGLERISAQSGTLKTQYVYDGRYSVAQSVVDGAVASSYTYTPFGEMLGGKETGFGFNAEWYDAATGMQNLRARQYEPAMNRFSQKDIVRGSMRDPLSLNRYTFVRNDPVRYADPSGLALVTAKPMQMYSDAGGYGSAQKDKVDVAVKKAAPKKSATTAVDNARTVAETGNLEGAKGAATDLYSNYGGLSSSQQQILDEAKQRYGNNIGSWTPMQAMAVCAAITLNQVAEYGRIGATSFTPEETTSTMAGVLYGTRGGEEILNAIQSKGLNLGDLKYGENTLCIAFITNGFIGTAFYEGLDKLIDSVLTTTSTFYAALAGEKDRKNNDVTGGKVLNEYVALVISAGNKNEMMKYKEPYAETYTILEGTKGMSLKEQLDIVLMSGVLQPLDVMFQAKINNENNEPYNYKIDVNQTHGVIFDGYTDEGVITYSGMNMKTQFKPITDLRIGNYLGLDFVLMSHENQPLDLVGMLDDWL